MKVEEVLVMVSALSSIATLVCLAIYFRYIRMSVDRINSRLEAHKERIGQCEEQINLLLGFRARNRKKGGKPSEHGKRNKNSKKEAR